MFYYETLSMLENQLTNALAATVASYRRDCFNDDNPRNRPPECGAADYILSLLPPPSHRFLESTEALSPGDEIRKGNAETNHWEAIDATFTGLLIGQRLGYFRRPLGVTSPAQDLRDGTTGTAVCDDEFEAIDWEAQMGFPCPYLFNPTPSASS